MINVTDALHEVITHVCPNVGMLSYVDPSRVLVCYAKAKTRSLHGIYAKISPTRFPGGSKTIEHRGHRYIYPPIIVDSQEMLYVMYFYYPRFQNLRFESKMLTIFHELYHILPAFDGTLRRFPGKYHAHGRSKEEYDEALKPSINAYLEKYGSADRLDFLKMDFRELEKRFGYVVGNTIKMPRPYVLI